MSVFEDPMRKKLKVVSKEQVVNEVYFLLRRDIIELTRRIEEVRRIAQESNKHAQPHALELQNLNSRVKALTSKVKALDFHLTVHNHSSNERELSERDIIKRVESSLDEKLNGSLQRELDRVLDRKIDSRIFQVTRLLKYKENASDANAFRKQFNRLLDIVNSLIEQMINMKKDVDVKSEETLPEFLKEVMNALKSMKVPVRYKELAKILSKKPHTVRSYVQRLKEHGQPISTIQYPDGSVKVYLKR